MHLFIDSINNYYFLVVQFIVSLEPITVHKLQIILSKVVQLSAKAMSACVTVRWVFLSGMLCF